jgi:hypothetical protein
MLVRVALFVVVIFIAALFVASPHRGVVKATVGSLSAAGR